MHIFPATIGKLRCDVTDDKEVLRDWDFPLIHRTAVMQTVPSKRSKPVKVAALCYTGDKISLKEDVVPTLFPVVEAMLMSSICKTHAATTIADHGPRRIEVSCQRVACQRGYSDVGPW